MAVGPEGECDAAVLLPVDLDRVARVVGVDQEARSIRSVEALGVGGDTRDLVLDVPELPFVRIEQSSAGKPRGLRSRAWRLK